MYAYPTTCLNRNSSTATAPQPASVVFIIADEASRESLKSLISAAGWRAEIFSSARDFLSRPRPNGPSCLIVDADLPDKGGLDLQKRVAAERSDMPVIFITGRGDVQMTVKAMRAGAIDVLPRPIDHELMVNAIAQALEQSSIALARGSEMKMLRERHAGLSRREQEVMALVVSGLLNKQVGFELGISEITVKAHRGHMMRKMQARSLPDLVTMAARLGIAAFCGRKREPHPLALAA